MLLDTCRLEDLAAADWAQARDWLSADEARRCETFANAKRMRQFLAARWLLRKLAGGYLGLAAQDIEIANQPSGMPMLAGRSDLHVSISHSGPRVACAVAAQPVGLDLECPGRPRHYQAMAEAICSPAQIEALRRAPSSQQEALFLQWWTLKEAWLKQRGQGLHGATMRALDWQDCAADDADAASWFFQDGAVLSLSAQTGTLATLSSPAPARYWAAEN